MLKKSSSNFDWRSSPAHLHLLSYFRRPNDVKYVAGMSKWNYVELGEKAADAIRRFRADGLLVPPDLPDTLEQAFNGAELKKLAKERGLKQSGTKAEVVERLIASDPSGMQRLAARLEMLIATEEAQQIIEDYLSAERERLARYQEQTFRALQEHRFRDACRAVAEHRQKKVYFSELGPQLSEPYQDHGDVERLEFVFKSRPKILAHLSEQQLEQLRIAVGMSMLWHAKVSDWLPETFTTRLPSAEIAANMLTCNARLLQEKAELQPSKYERISGIRLERYRGIGVCGLCDSAFDKTYTSVDEIPELPIEGCISETGCEFYLRPEYSFADDENDSRDRLDWTDMGDEEDEVDEPSAFDRLKELKQMLDAGLITQQEYDQTKARILSEM